MVGRGRREAVRGAAELQNRVLGQGHLQDPAQFRGFCPRDHHHSGGAGHDLRFVFHQPAARKQRFPHSVLSARRGDLHHRRSGVLQILRGQPRLSEHPPALAGHGRAVPHVAGGSQPGAGLPVLCQYLAVDGLQHAAVLRGHAQHWQRHLRGRRDRRREQASAVPAHHLPAAARHPFHGVYSGHARLAEVL